MVGQSIGLIVDQATLNDVPVVTDPRHKPVVAQQIHPGYGCVMAVDEAFLAVGREFVIRRFLKTRRPSFRSASLRGRLAHF